MSSNNCFTCSNSALQYPMLRNGADTQTDSGTESRFRFSLFETEHAGQALNFLVSCFQAHWFTLIF